MPLLRAHVIAANVMKEQIVLQTILRTRFEELRLKNSSFSARSFARRLNINSGALSAILSGKRNVSVKLAERIADKLLLDPQERHELLSKFSNRKIPSKNSATGVTTGELIDAQYLKVSAAQFRMIADWEHFAVLSLLDTNDFESNNEWIAKRLGVSEKRISVVMDNLLQLNLVALNNDGKLFKTNENIRSPDDIADISIKRSHEQAMDQAKSSLHRDSIEDRDFSSITMAIDLKKLGMAKELIRKFQDELSDLVETGDRTEVYRLSMQMVPISVLRKSGVKE